MGTIKEPTISECQETSDWLDLDVCLQVREYLFSLAFTHFCHVNAKSTVKLIRSDQVVTVMLASCCDCMLVLAHTFFVLIFKAQ